MHNLEYVSDWMGGRYQITEFGNAGVITLDDVSRFWIKPQDLEAVEVQATLKKVNGVDDDHGHKYDWTRTDAYITVFVLGVPVTVPLMQFIEKGVVFVEV